MLYEESWDAENDKEARRALPLLPGRTAAPAVPVARESGGLGRSRLRSLAEVLALAIALTLTVSEGSYCELGTRIAPTS